MRSSALRLVVTTLGLVIALVALSSRGAATVQPFRCVDGCTSSCPNINELYALCNQYCGETSYVFCGEPDYGNCSYPYLAYYTCDLI